MDKATSIEKFEFHSPINREGSWGERSIAKKAKSVMELFFNKDNTGFIEWEVPHYGLYEDIGLTFEIGIGGGRLSPAQRQKLAIARALLKQPDLMIVDEATAALDPSGRTAMRRNLIAACENSGVVWVLPDLGDADGFDRVIVMDSGRVLEQGALSAVIGRSESSQAAS